MEYKTDYKILLRLIIKNYLIYKAIVTASLAIVSFIFNDVKFLINVLPFYIVGVGSAMGVISSTIKRITFSDKLITVTYSFNNVKTVHREFLRSAESIMTKKGDITYYLSYQDVEKGINESQIKLTNAYFTLNDKFEIEKEMNIVKNLGSSVKCNGDGVS